MVIKTVYYAIKSRIKPIKISTQDCINILNNNQWKRYGYLNYINELDYSIYNRLTNVMSATNIWTNIYFYPMPHSFYYYEFKRFLSGLGFSNLYGNRLILVAKYSLFKPDEYPYLEHEVLHALGLLRPDHSNWNDYKDIGRYR